jgi:protein-S-isoprenylcysteine O-methyltransferase Ste14
VLSRRAFANPKCHGFYRFFAFELIMILGVLNYSYWHQDMLFTLQLISWVCLLISILLAVRGYRSLRDLGGFAPRPSVPENFIFENTEKLVTEEVYRHIRHPMYSALLFLAWGIYFKHLTVVSTVAVLLATALLLVTAKLEELENIAFFGSAYKAYMKKTKMFIPYLF